MAARGIVLAANVGTVANTPAATWQGGRGILVNIATTYPTTCALQTMGPDGVTWINVSANITANGVTPFDLPAGQYRILMTGGAVAGFYANLVSISYT